MTDNPNDEKFENIEIRLPMELLNILKSMAMVEDKSVSQIIVGLLDMAIFIAPEDLEMIKDKAIREANLKQLEGDEDIMVEKYKAHIAAINKAADDLTKLKGE